MNSYRYIGDDPSLEGHTALGRIAFVVQVDDIQHPMAIGWHLANPDNWEVIPSEFSEDAEGPG